MARFDAIVYIGRFQPFHLGHLATVRSALDEGDTVVIVVGSVNRARSVKNPFSFDERMQMILRALRSELRPGEIERVRLVPVRDYDLDDSYWIQEVVNSVRRAAPSASTIALIGFHKDASSYYLDLFPDWRFIAQPPTPEIDATRVRSLWLDGKRGYSSLLPPAVTGALDAYQYEDDEQLRSVYRGLQEEHWFVREYRKQWAGTPYPPTFVTVDAVIFCNGHVLHVVRRDPPGRGQLALPGGYIREDETIIKATLRELREETRATISDDDLRRALRETRVFDSPSRDARGRTITHASLFHLSERFAPIVHGDDDAASAQWTPLLDVYRDERAWYADHFQIIDYFRRKAGITS